MPNVNEVDAAFVIDVTASMGTFIRDAQRLLVKLLKEMSGAADIDLCVGIIEYRDHPPEDRSFVTRSFALTEIYRRSITRSIDLVLMVVVMVLKLFGMDLLLLPN